MRADEIIAGVMIEMAEEKGLKIGSIGDISQCLYEHKGRGQDISEITLQRTPFGFHSLEVAQLIGRLLTAGLAKQGNPVELTQQGLEWLKKLAC
jgi:hypothetical protein